MVQSLLKQRTIVTRNKLSSGSNSVFNIKKVIALFLGKGGCKSLLSSACRKKPEGKVLNASS
jgi:hypothetical protein